MKKFDWIDFILNVLILAIIFGLAWTAAKLTVGLDIAHAETVTVSVSVPCNNLNWQTSPRCTAPVSSFYVDALGNVTGELESGVSFTQTRITASLMLFEMEEVRWLTNGYTTIYI